MGRGGDIQWEAPFGTMMPAYYALYAQAYLAKNGLTLDDLRDVRVKAATYGQINERAVYRKGVKPEDFDPKNPDAKMAGPVASPLRVGDCCANADGASCIILANAEKAKIFQKKPVWILGIGAASEVVNMASRPDFSKGIQVAKAAANVAYKMAGVGPKDINVAEVHDCFTIAEIMAYEGLGFAPEGDGKSLIREKATYKEGKIPVNVDGGLLSKATRSEQRADRRSGPSSSSSGRSRPDAGQRSSDRPQPQYRRCGPLRKRHYFWEGLRWDSINLEEKASPASRKRENSSTSLPRAR